MSSHFQDSAARTMEPGTPDPAVLERVTLSASALAGTGIPTRVLIAPWGEVHSTHGSFVVDEASALAVVEAFARHGTDIPIDYEHQSLGGPYASPSGQAPAAGWIRALRVVKPDEPAGTEAGLVAEVEWTDAAREKLQSREYRYLSPVVLVRRRDRRVIALHSAALTNKPAILGMRPIVNRDEAPAASAPSSEAVAQGDGHDDPFTADGAPTLRSARDAAPAAVVAVLRHRLGLPDDSDEADVLLAADNRLADLMQHVARREAAQRVSAAVRAGKLVPRQRAWAMSLALHDAAGFDAWLASAPVVVHLGRTSPPGEGDGWSARLGQTAVMASARAAFRAEPALALITTEEAWVRDALREAGISCDPSGDGAGRLEAGLTTASEAGLNRSPRS